MGIRLYPNTQDRAALETLAGVPAGTYDRLDAMQARHDAAEKAAPFDQELGYKNWKERNDDGPIGDLDSFLTFGWGKFHPVDGIGLDCAGSEENLDSAAKLLRFNGVNVDVALCEGVHWC